MFGRYYNLRKKPMIVPVFILSKIIIFLIGVSTNKLFHRYLFEILFYSNPGVYKIRIKAISQIFSIYNTAVLFLKENTIFKIS